MKYKNRNLVFTPATINSSLPLNEHCKHSDLPSTRSATFSTFSNALVASCFENPLSLICCMNCTASLVSESSSVLSSSSSLLSSDKDVARPQKNIAMCDHFVNVRFFIPYNQTSTRQEVQGKCMQDHSSMYILKMSSAALSENNPQYHFCFGTVFIKQYSVKGDTDMNFIIH